MAAVGPSNKEWGNCGTIITLLKTDLYAVSNAERNVFMSTVGVLCLLSLTGNIGMLCVNFRRRQLRPFFRACLFSLALSDLTSTLLLTTVYITQLSAEFLQIWSLGRNMCKLVPYVSSAVILANSITLVAIALDRYFALMNSVLVRHRDPNIILCVAYMFGIWVVCIVFSLPLLYIYKFEWVHVYEEQTQSSICQLEQAMEVLPMCISDDRGFGIYYIILTVLIFFMSIVGFFWLNTMIARKLWKRRHNITARAGHTSPPFTVVHSVLPAGEGRSTETRKVRHMRMFVIILMLMTTFMFLRLPAWIFLIMRIYASYSKPIDWMLYCCFAVLNMFSCVLNPLLYTFLTETIICVSRVKGHLMRWFRFPESCSYFCGMMDSAKSCCFRIAKIEEKNVDSVTQLEDIKNLASQQLEPQTPLGETSLERVASVELCGNSDSLKSMNICHQSIYTVFPHSLITSTISLQPPID